MWRALRRASVSILIRTLIGPVMANIKKSIRNQGWKKRHEAKEMKKVIHRLSQKGGDKNIDVAVQPEFGKEEVRPSRL